MSANHGGLLLLHSAELALLEKLRLWGWERLLFIDCGDGWVAEEAWRRLVKGCVCGVDRSPELVAGAARMRGVPDKLEFKTWDGRQLPYPDAYFDSVVWPCDAADWTDVLGVVCEMRRVARAGAELYLVGSPRGVDLLAGTSEWQNLLEQAGLLLHDTRSFMAENTASRILRACSAAGVP